MKLNFQPFVIFSYFRVEKDSRREVRSLPNISPGMFAYYIMALNSTCHDVTNFYKNDLIDILSGHLNRFPQS